MIRPFTAAALSVLVLSWLTACEGTVSLDISATPPENIESAILRIDSVRLSKDDGTTQDIDLGDDFEINAVELSQGRVRALISDEEIGAGSYTGLTLVLDAESETLDSRLLLNDGSEVSLILRSGSSMTVNQAFSIRDEDDTALTLHLDMRSSLLLDSNAVGDRLLSPRLRLIANSEAGSIAGDIETQLLIDAGCDDDNDPSLGEVAYVYSGSDIIAEELDGTVPDPVTTALITREAANADYVAAFLPAGDYTVAVSCNADLDDPLRTDGTGFVASRNTSVSAGDTTTLNFTVE